MNRRGFFSILAGVVAAVFFKPKPMIESAFIEHRLWHIPPGLDRAWLWMPGPTIDSIQHSEPKQRICP